jgi:hypothetical protein
LEGTARKRTTKVKKKNLQQMGKERRALEGVGAEFNNAPRIANDGYTASIKVKFNLVSMQFIQSACFQADRL